ncbi:MAG: MMPL family transporter [Nevskia sp.]|nr:MMPL family transporter [Nevskia sp.]
MQNLKAESTLARALRGWVERVQAHPRQVAGLALLLAGLVGWYTLGHLSVDTDPENMLSPKLGWRQAEQRMDRLFPEQDVGMVLVVDGATPEVANDAEQRLVKSLGTQTDHFAEVYAAETDPYFRRNGLLYLDTPALQKMADGLDQAQPFLGALAHDPSLHGLFTLLDRALTNPESGDFDFAPALGKVAEGVEAAAAGRYYALSWQALMGTGVSQDDAGRRFIEVKPRLDYERLFPAQAAVDAIRATIGGLELDAAHGVKVRLTGSIAMEHEELRVAFSGGLKAFALGLLIVVGLLYLALRSWRLVAAAVITLLFGLLLTAGFAALAVGHLNLISIAFSVLYVGLGIDYALYLCMQYRELLGGGLAQREALPRAAGDVGSFMLVCAATTSIGFFAFIPTPFTGIAELGIISGAGMFISLAVSLSLLPALISLFPPDPARVKLRPPGSGLLGRVLEWPYTRARTIWTVAALLAAGSLLLLPKARFDYDPIDLRDPASESVSTFRDLLHDPSIPTLTLSVLTDSAEQARTVSRNLSELSLVKQAITLLDLVPADQDAKLAIIADLNLTLGPALSAGSGPLQLASRTDDYAAIHELGGVLPAYTEQHADRPEAKAAQALQSAIQQLDAAWEKGDGAAHEQLLGRLRYGLLSAMPQQIDSLRDALQAGPVTEKDLPAQLARRWKSADGHYRVEIWPKEVMDNPAAMERFVAQVRSVAPDASGGAIGFIESGHAVTTAFKQAFLYSFVAITVLLLVMLRSVADTLLVLIPLALAGMLTVAGAVLLDVPFNFANVIALPLILGVGVDYGVYLAQRGRVTASAHVNLLQTGTARAVLFGALITTANFGNLMLARHPGIVSMGVLLTVGLSMTLVCALVLLPSLLARRYGASSGKG